MAPKILLIPASFTPASTYNYWLEYAKPAGLDVTVIVTPSVGRKPAGQAPATMSDDVVEIVRVAEPLLDAGEEVVILAHSYGGLPGSQSMQYLSSKARAVAGKTGGIDKIIYLASVVLPVGVLNAPICFNDLPPDEALERAKGFDTHSTASFKDKLTFPGYDAVKDIYYIFTEQDQVVVPSAQEAMIGMINAIRGQGREVHVERITSGHAPNFSQPEELLRIVQGIVN